MHVLFVCTGNICRSPIAERLAVAMADARQIQEFRASSAGTRAVIAHPMHSEAASVLRELGGDSSDFLARQLSQKIAKDADLILTMTRAHRDRVLELAPPKLNRTFTLIEAARLRHECGAQTLDDLPRLRSSLAADRHFDVADPIGQSPEFFASIGSQIAKLLPSILELCSR